MWIFGWKGPSGFSARSTAEQVTQGIDGTSLTAIVTGASGGIGAETAKVLAMRGVHVIMAVRNVETGNKVKDEILNQISPAKVQVMQLDLSSTESVRRFASKYISSGLPLNILINNAGIALSPFKLSEDNIEIQFATNYLGHFLLTHLLLETMKNTAHESHQEGRIVNVSSMSHRHIYELPLDKISDESEYNSWTAYARSKLAMVLHTKELARRFKEEGVNITVNSLHPGLIPTKITSHIRFADALSFLGKLVLKNVEQGAATTCYVAMNPQVKGVSGEYFENSNIAKPNDAALDEQLAKKLWDFSFSLINSK